MNAPKQSSPEEGEFEFGTNPFNLNLKDWVAVFVIVGLGAVAIPMLFERAERFDPQANYRVHHEQSNDYWSLARWTKAAAEDDMVLVLGDSAIWGHYVDNEHTLTAELNRKAGAARFRNLGVSGMHSAAMLGLVRLYGSPIRNQDVVVQFAPLWSVTPNADLQGDAEARFQHPKLCEQYFNAPKCYHAPLEERLGVTAQRTMPLLMLSDHMMNQYLDHQSLAEWVMEHPDENPAARFSFEIPSGPTDPEDRSESWVSKKMPSQDYPWVLPDESYQWANFQKAIEVLRGRGNRVFVLLGPFNPHILTAGSLRRYRRLQQDAENGLHQNGIPYAWAAELPSELYGDTSHPLAEGYVRIAEDLWSSKAFSGWIRGGGETSTASKEAEREGERRE